MNGKNTLLISIFVLLHTITVSAQCYLSNYNKGKAEFDAGQYSVAKATLQIALGCDDVGSFNNGADAQALIVKCNYLISVTPVQGVLYGLTDYYGLKYNYNGMVLNGKPHGKGSATYSEGEIRKYVGDFINGIMQGKGVLYLENGDSYEGDFINGVRSGSGKYFFSDGTVYDGDWEMGVINGTGEMLRSDGTLYYVGDFMNNDITGEGIMYTADGDVYEGHFENSNLSGVCVLKYSNGTRFEGEWFDVSNSGKGTFFYPNGDRKTGVYSEGYLKTGAFLYANGDRYEGEFVNGIISGKGILYYKNGDKFDGTWTDRKNSGNASVVCGSGTIYYHSGEKYVGQVGNMREPYGEGTVYHTNGMNYTSEFSSGTLDEIEYGSYLSNRLLDCDDCSWVVVENDDNKYGICDRFGKLIVNYQYDDIGVILDGVYKARMKNNWGVIDGFGNILLEFKFSRIDDEFCEGMLSVSKDDKCGYVNSQWKLVVLPKYSNCNCFQDGEANVLDPNEGWIVIDKNGNKIQN